MILTFNHVYFMFPKLSLLEVKHEFGVTMKIFSVLKPKKVLLFDLQITLVFINDSPISID